LSDDSPFPFKFFGKAGYEHSNKKKHLIIEFRRNDFEICKPKHITGKAHWYSRERNWLVHYTGDRDVDIRELK